MIAANAGFEGSIVVEKSKKRKVLSVSMPASMSIKICWRQALLDPTKVARFALQNASSVALPLLTTQCMVADKTGRKRRRRYAQRLRRRLSRHGEC